MQAAFIRATGGTDRIEFGTLPVPRPGPTDLLVSMEASAVNHVDLLVRSGAYPTHTPFPFIIGRDLVGTVVMAGSGIGQFKAGDHIWCNSLGHARRQGAFAEYAVVPSDRAYPLPRNVTPAAAAPILHTGATAVIGLMREAKLQAGETIFVGGGAGGVGSAVLQLAAISGARIVASCAQADMAWCSANGADVVIDYQAADLYEQIASAAPAGIDVWWDTSGHYDLERTLPLLTTGARVVVMAGIDASISLPVGALYTRDVSLHGFAISNASVADLADAARVINVMLSTGRLSARIGATYHLADARLAHEAMEHHAVQGRILIVP